MFGVNSTECLGSWAIGNNCERCAKCVESNPYFDSTSSHIGIRLNGYVDENNKVLSKSELDRRINKIQSENAEMKSKDYFYTSPESVQNKIKFLEFWLEDNKEILRRIKNHPFATKAKWLKDMCAVGLAGE